MSKFTPSDTEIKHQFKMSVGADGDRRNELLIEYQRSFPPHPSISMRRKIRYAVRFSNGSQGLLGLASNHLNSNSTYYGTIIHAVVLIIST